MTQQESALSRPDGALATRLRKEVQGDVLFDMFSRGRYSTDASIYQIMPVGVVVPRTAQDAYIALQIARELGVPILPRGGGTSQCGQTVGAALVIDNTKYLNSVVSFDAAQDRVTVQPGIVLDQLNKHLRPQGLFFPVDVSTGNRATIGGMAGNNSCGSRSLRYGNMVHNVRAIDAVLADGARLHFSERGIHARTNGGSSRHTELTDHLRALHAREAGEIAARFPKLLRRVGGYNIDCLGPDGNIAHLLVGSEGTLAYFNEIELQLQPVPRHKTLGVCHFPRFHDAMDAAQHIVKLGPAAVELVDRTMIDLAREIAAFRDTVDRFLQGEPDAILLVEFAGEDNREQLNKLARLSELMSDLGFPGSVVSITDAALQKDTWEVRKAGLNVMMSMKGDGKPVSFIEDCAVPLEDLAEYTDRLTRVFEKHGTRGTWYAHASVGCLHVRPILNMKDPNGAKTMRAIAEEAFELVRHYKGSHSGEHGDGLVRSEWHEPMFGARIVHAFEEVKRAFDPAGLMNPGKIVGSTRMDDRSLFRFAPNYRVQHIDTAFDWSAWGGFGGAVEMCNNNGACRKSDPGVMCPSYRATADEQHLTRGRANSLRLAISGQLGPNAWLSK
ncbi:MAG TPA: FAD-binding oxidoreductase, partial [Burkholderiales bacterium]